MTSALKRARTTVAAAAGLFALASGAVVVLFFFQPWRSCEYEDTSAGCAMLPQDAAVMGIAALSCLVGTAAVVAALTWPRASSSPASAADRDAHPRSTSSSPT